MRHVRAAQGSPLDVELRCEFDERAPTDRIEVEVEVVNPLAVNFDTAGLLRPQATYGGKVGSLPVRLEPGTHRFRIAAALL